MSFDEVKDRLPSFITEEFWHVVRPNIDLLTEARYWWDLVHEDIIPEVEEEDKEYLQQAIDCLPENPWDEETWGQWTAKLKEISGRKGKSLFHPLRMALTREEKGPEMKGMLPLMGRDRVLRRLQEAVSR